jgi:MFS family permease
MNWLPDYLAEQFHMYLAKVGIVAALPWLLSIVMMLLVGYLSDYIVRKTANLRWARSYPIFISQFIATLCIIPVIFFKNINVAIIFISLGVGFSMASNSVLYATNIDVAKERSGTALGIMTAIFAVSGFLSPVITGWSISITKHFTSSFLILMILGLSSVLIVFTFHHPELEKRLTE